MTKTTKNKKKEMKTEEVKENKIIIKTKKNKKKEKKTEEEKKKEILKKKGIKTVEEFRENLHHPINQNKVSLGIQSLLKERQDKIKQINELCQQSGYFFILPAKVMKTLLQFIYLSPAIKFVFYCFILF